MSRKGVIQQPTFAGGEVSPQLYGRVDLQRYYSSLKTCRNFIVRPQGGVENRAGTKLVGTAPQINLQLKLIPFQFSTTQSYVLVFTHLSMRVIREAGFVLTGSAMNITGVTKDANAAVVTSAGHGLSDGDVVYIDGVAGMTELNGRTFRAGVSTAPTPANQFQIYEDTPLEPGVDSSGYETYVSGGAAQQVYELATPFTGAQVAGVRFVQSADVMYLVHPDRYPQKLSRFADDTWTLARMDIGSTAETPAGLSGVWTVGGVTPGPGDGPEPGDGGWTPPYGFGDGGNTVKP